VACFLVRRRDVLTEGVQRECPPPQPDIAAFGAVAITDAVIRFVTMRLTTLFFSGLYAIAIPLEHAVFVQACAMGVFLLCSFIVVMLISKALLPTTLGRAAFISGLKVALQFGLAFSLSVLLTMLGLF
jgi:hypothetical protein